MSLHHIANHLASKGRNGDTTLVHMTKGEVDGLQALAKAHGTSLTRNPHTGLPEAFSLKSLVPMAAGAGLMAMGVPAPIAGGLVGLGAYATTGSLTQGLMAGLGAYGGAGLAGMAGVGAPAGTQAVAGQFGEAAVPTEAVSGIDLGGAGASPATTGPVLATPEVPKPIGADFEQMPVQDQWAYQTEKPAVSGIDLGGAGSSPANMGAPKSMGATFIDNAKADPWGATRYGAAAVAPSLIQQPEGYRPPEIKSDSDMGQRYAFESGYDNSIPGRTGPASYRQISNEEAKKLYGFAEGGEVQYPVGEPVMRMASGGSAGYTGNVGDYSAADAAAARSGYGLGINYSGYDTPVNQGIVAIVPSKPRAPATSAATQTQGLRYDPVSGTYIGSGTDAPYLGGGQYGKTQAELDAEESAKQEQSGRPRPGYYNPIDSTYAAGGGISTLGGYSDGGRLLKGPGDGMSDNIPAQIGAKQPARLADGEFVVPADVVSHLGNGSTDAGAKQLYKMMDKVRTARTGRKAQGKQINPNKYVPA